MPTAVSMSKMLEMAIGTPERGAVNFNTLQQLLEAMIKKMGLADVMASLEDSPPGGAPPAALGRKASFVPGASKSSYSDLQEKVMKIEQELHTMNASEMPASVDIMAKVREEKPLTDFWQTMKQNKKVDNNEEAIGKLMELTEKLIRDNADLRQELDDMKQKMPDLNMKDLNDRLANLEKMAARVSELENASAKMGELDDVKAGLDELRNALGGLPDPSVLVTWPALEDALNGVRDEFSQIIPKMIFAPAPTNSGSGPAVKTASLPAVRKSPPPSPASPVSKGLRRHPSMDLQQVLQRMGTLNSRHDALVERVDELELELKNKANTDDMGAKVPDDLLNSVDQMKGSIARLEELREKDSESITRAQAAIMQLQGELEAMQQMIDHLSAENGSRVKQLEDVGRDISRLDATKVDKQHLLTELDVKANKNSVDNKVEKGLFDSACTDLQKMITDLLSKLQAYEEAWRRAHDKIEEDVDGKLDRTEIDSLKKYLDKKMKELNAKMKQTSGLINPYCDDAAGLKKQLLPFNCLSCDKPVMATGTGLGMQGGPPGDGFTPQRSARPYTTYELDQIRHHAKSLLHTDGTIDYFNMPRSCGGSHTMTQPHRRVNRSYTGEITLREDEMEPQPPAREETDIIGADGHIYRGRMSDLGIPTPKNSLDARLPTNMQDRSQRPSSTASNRRPKTAAGRMGIGGATSISQRPHSTSPTPRPQSARPSSTGSAHHQQQPMENGSPSVAGLAVPMVTQVPVMVSSEAPSVGAPAGTPVNTEV